MAKEKEPDKTLDIKATDLELLDSSKTVSLSNQPQTEVKVKPKSERRENLLETL